MAYLDAYFGLIINKIERISKLNLIEELINNNANITLAIKITDLKEFADYLINRTQRELEAILLTEKAETYPTPKQVSEILNVNLVTLWRWNKTGYLKTLEFGGGRRYRMSDVKALFE